jgi:hypothetical protein
MLRKKTTTFTDYSGAATNPLKALKAFYKMGK